MPFAAAVSHHPVTAHATGEAVGQVIDQIGTHPDVLAIVVSPGHAGALEDVAATVRSLLEPSVLIGWVASGVASEVITNSRPASALGLWAATTGPVAPLRWANPARPDPDGVLALPFEVRGLVVIGAPTGGGGPDLPSTVPVVGAVSDVAGGPIVLDGGVFVDGAVGVALGPGVDLSFAIEEGRRRIGPPLTVTAAAGPLLVTLADRPAMTVLSDIAKDHVRAPDITLINRSVHLLVTAARTGSGPTLRAIRGRDGGSGALVIEPPVESGDVVQFCVLDPHEARKRARQGVAGSSGRGALIWQAGGAVTSGTGPDGGPGPDGRVRTVLACRAAALLGPSLSPCHGRGAGTRPDGIGVGLFVDG